MIQSISINVFNFIILDLIWYVIYSGSDAPEVHKVVLELILLLWN